MILFMSLYNEIIGANCFNIHKLYNFDNIKSGSKGERTA